jgi:hypothetical protein
MGSSICHFWYWPLADVSPDAAAANSSKKGAVAGPLGDEKLEL